LRSALCGHRKFRQASCNPSTWRQEASILRLETFMLGPETLTLLMRRQAPCTTHLHPGPHTRRVMCHRGRDTELLHSMEQPDQCTRLSQPTLTNGQSTHPLMWKNFHRGRPPLCLTAAVSVVQPTQLMVRRYIVTRTRDRGAARREPFLWRNRARDRELILVKTDYHTRV
jgi:hypothetical protein